MFKKKRGLLGLGRKRKSFLFEGESLEPRQLMATGIDLANIQSAPYGNEMLGALASDGAGYKITDVGDINRSGYDSYVVSAPTVLSPSTSGVSLGTGTSKFYLVLGTKPVGTTSPVGIANISNSQRAGDLGTLGTTTQVNPTVAPTTPTTLGFQYDGITYTTGATPNSQLGASVAALGDINGDGYDDFMIGAPNDTGGGRAYVIYGGGHSPIPPPKRSTWSRLPEPRITPPSISAFLPP